MKTADPPLRGCSTGQDDAAGAIDDVVRTAGHVGPADAGHATPPWLRCLSGE
jgi:hypothetical protein